MARTTFCASTEQRCGMDAERLERAARALVREVRRSGALPLALATDTLERSVDAIESALAAPAPASAEAVARAVRQADLVPYNTPQEYDVACAQRAACEMAALNCIDAMRPGGADAQAGEAVAWQIVDHNYGPTHYFGMTEDDAWARMVKASGEGRSVWARTRFARPLYAAHAPAQADPWAWAVLLPGNTPQQARIRMTEREAMSCAAELPGFVIVPLYAAPSRPGGAS